MAHTNLSHRRTHNLLLISKLLSQREGASPFTLIQDTLEQSARPLLREYTRRANLSKCHVIFLAFETIKAPAGVDTFIKCFDKTPAEVAEAVSKTIAGSNTTSKRFLIVIDSLLYLSTLSTQTTSPLNLTNYLTTLIQLPIASLNPPISLVAVYHTDIPLPTTSNPHAPTPLSILAYLATTIITVHSLPNLLASKAAADRSLAAPSFGLAEELEGVLIGLNAHSKTIKASERGIVLELEHRRKSGRGVLEWYFLPAVTIRSATTTSPAAFRESVTLLDDHPLFRRQTHTFDSVDDLGNMTFELGLTERQRLERDGVVLPYMDAQKLGGGSEGGRILYDMGAEDDFDEEEDEI